MLFKFTNLYFSHVRTFITVVKDFVSYQDFSRQEMLGVLSRNELDQFNPIKARLFRL